MLEHHEDINIEKDNILNVKGPQYEQQGVRHLSLTAFYEFLEYKYFLEIKNLIGQIELRRNNHLADVCKGINIWNIPGSLFLLED